MQKNGHKQNKTQDINESCDSVPSGGRSLLFEVCRITRASFCLETTLGAAGAVYDRPYFVDSKEERALIERPYSCIQLEIHEFRDRNELAARLYQGEDSSPRRRGVDATSIKISRSHLYAKRKRDSAQPQVKERTGWSDRRNVASAPN